MAKSYLKPSRFSFLVSPLSILLLLCSCGPQIDQKYRQEIAAQRMAMNEAFLDPNQTPVDSLHFQSFKGLKFFPIDEQYKVKATISLLENQEVFNLPHSHNSSRPYKNFGKISFELKGNSYELIVLEQDIKKTGYDDYLLLPFTDETNGKETYGGGRYLDLDKSLIKGNKTEITIDFNKAYNPYCAYSSAYTCPIPPKENHLPTNIEAGVKYDAKEFGH